jgi:hypothetical protein
LYFLVDLHIAEARDGMGDVGTPYFNAQTIAKFIHTINIVIIDSYTTE